MGRVRGLAAGLAWLIVAAPAQATTTSISVSSDRGDFIGRGLQRVFDPSNTRDMGARMEGETVVAWASGGPYGEGYSFAFAAPPGEALEPRNYVGAQRLPFRKPGHPGLEVTGGSRGCNALDGRFEVRDLVHDGAGKVTRLWVVFQQHCEGAQPAAWGEVRINAPAGESQIAPGIVRWPPLDSWRQATEVPVTYRGAAPVVSASLAGSHADDFRLDAGGCQGRAGPCEVLVRFVPGQAGTREATLRIIDTTGTVHETALEGFAHGGITSATIEVLPGDEAGQPGTYSYGPENATFEARADEYTETSVAQTNVFITGADDRSFYGSFGAGGATVLEPGSYAPAGTHGPGPWLWISGSPLYCSRSGGDFRVNELTRMPDGELRSFDVSFEQDCYDDHRAAHRGRWRYRAGDTAPPAPWLVPGARPRLAPPHADGGGAVAAGPAPGAVPDAGGGGHLASPISGAPTGPSRARRPRVRADWNATRTVTRVRRLLVERVPAGARVDVRCVGSRCPFERRSVSVRSGRADAGRRLKGITLRPRTTLELRISARGRAIAIIRYVIRRGHRPAVDCSRAGEIPCRS